MRVFMCDEMGKTHVRAYPMTMLLASGFLNNQAVKISLPS